MTDELEPGTPYPKLPDNIERPDSAQQWNPRAENAGYDNVYKLARRVLGLSATRSRKIAEQLVEEFGQGRCAVMTSDQVRMYL